MRKWGWHRVVILLFVLAWGGCVGDQHVVRAPPASPVAAEKWWAESVDSWDLGFLAVLVEASEIHRQNGTTATYKSHFMGRTMIGWYHSETRFPVPLPEQALARAKVRLAEYTPDPERFDIGPYRVDAQEGKNCSAEKAMEIWREVEKKYRGRDD